MNMPRNSGANAKRFAPKRLHSKLPKLPEIGKPDKSIWNSLEMVKILAAILTPIAVAVVGIVINSNIREADKNQQLKLAVADISKLVYERYARSIVLRGAIERYSKYPSEGFQQELVREKQKHDDVVVQWNGNIQASLFVIRRLHKSERRTDLERKFERRLVVQSFYPLYKCLDSAYEAALVRLDAPKILNQCKADKLFTRALSCAYSFTDVLFRLSKDQVDQDVINNELNRLCPDEILDHQHGEERPGAMSYSDE